jgi:hypothetical protein
VSHFTERRGGRPPFLDSVVNGSRELPFGVPPDGTLYYDGGVRFDLAKSDLAIFVREDDGYGPLKWRRLN